MPQLRLRSSPTVFLGCGAVGKTEQLAELDTRIKDVEDSLVTLRQELEGLKDSTQVYLRVRALIAFGESSLAGMRAQRAKLEAQKE